MAELVTSVAPRTPVRVVPIWHSEVKESDRGADELRRKFGLEDRVVFLYAGHASHRHPLGPLATAFDQLPHASRSSLLVVGGGPEVEKLRLDERFRTPRVLFAEAVDRSSLGDLLRMADVHCVSLATAAVGTCVPSKMYAAMAASRAILLAGGKGSQSSLDLVESRGGLQVPLDSLEIAHAVQELENCASARISMGERGNEYFCAKRDIKAGVKAWRFILDGDRRETILTNDS